jgi:hypothetical protein
VQKIRAKKIDLMHLFCEEFKILTQKLSEIKSLNYSALPNEMINKMKEDIRV